MKRVINFIFLCVILLLTTSKVYALSVSKNNFTINRGENDKIELYANSDVEITSVEFTLVYTSNDVRTNFVCNGSYTYSGIGANTHKVSFGEGKSGKILLGTININVSSDPKDAGGSINIHSAKGYKEDGSTVNLNTQIVNVSIGNRNPASSSVPAAPSSKVEEKKEENKEETKKEEEKKEDNETDNNLIEKITSKIVKLEVKKDIFEYSVLIDKDVKELDLVAVGYDDDTKINISSQKIDELEDNKIIITATKGDIKQEYVIKVNIKEEIDVTIDRSEFKENNRYKGKWILMSILLVAVLIAGLLFSKKK